MRMSPHLVHLHDLLTLSSAGGMMRGEKTQGCLGPESRGPTPSWFVIYLFIQHEGGVLDSRVGHELPCPNSRLPRR